MNQKQFNEFITDACNANRIGRTKKVLWFLKRAYKINTEQQMPFDSSNFPELTQTNYRQLIHKVRPLIEVVVDGRPKMYKLKGIRLPGEQEKITQKVTGDEFSILTNQLEHQPPSLHDIKSKTTIVGKLYQQLVELGAHKNKNNGGIRIDIPTRDGFVFKAIVYPNTVQIDIGCTSNPLVYNLEGVLRLISLLNHVKLFIEFSGSFSERLPEVMDWVITHYHFAKDGVSFDGPRFHFTVENVASGLIRCYVKTAKNGKQFPRLEQIRTPRRSLSEELEHVLEAQQNV